MRIFNDHHDWALAVSSVLIVAGMLSMGATPARAGTVQYEVSMVGPPQGSSTLYSYTYFLSGFNFSANEDLDIQFNPALFGSLSNGVAGSDFTLFLFQPNNPPGSHGDYDILANVDHPSLTGTFSVDFTWTGPGTPLDPGAPVAQQFVMDQFNSDGSCSTCPLPGGPFSTVPASGVPAVPEPGTASLILPGIVVCAALWRFRRRRTAAPARIRIRANH